MTLNDVQNDFEKWEICNICGGYADAVRNFGKRYGKEDWEPCCMYCFTSIEPWLSKHYSKYKNSKENQLRNGQLQWIFNLKSTEIVLKPYVILVDEEWGAIGKTARGMYVGTVTKKGETLAIAEMTFKQYCDAWEDTDLYIESARAFIIARHVKDAAGVDY